MTPGHWMKIAALASALGLSGMAIAQDRDATSVTAGGDGVSANEPPAAGAIVMPEDKAAGMGKSDEQGRDGNVAPDDDTSTSNDDMSINPGPSSDDMSINPGTANDDISASPDHDGADDSSPGYGTPASSGFATDRDHRSGVDEDEAPSPDRDVQPGDMGPADMRGQ